MLDNSKELLKRSDIASEYKWNLSDIFANDELWEESYQKLTKVVGKGESLKGHLADDDGKVLFEALCLKFDIELDFERAYVYAFLQMSQDNSDPSAQAKVARITTLASKINVDWSFMEPELVKIYDKIEGFYEKTPELSKYKFILDDIARNIPHVLSEAEERIVTLAQDALRTGDNTFGFLDNADMVFPIIKNDEGKRERLTNGKYTSFMRSKDQDTRKRAFKALYKTYASYRNTITACYQGNVKADVFNMTVSKHKSSLEAALFGDNVPTSVYKSLIKAVNDRLPALNDYISLRKDVLGLPKLHMYDLYVPFTNAPKHKYTFEEGRDIVLDALKPLGPDYIKNLRRAFDEHWIDVFETPGKTTGAFSIGMYGVHPYVLLNWQGTLDDIFTLAHELGHAMHSLYSDTTQPFYYSNYSIFVAEVASTVNENLLIKYLLAKTTDKDERNYLLNHYLEEFRATVFRQTMFAEFELKVHEMEEQGEALTWETLNKVYRRLNVKYYGKSTIIDKDINFEWMRIPHFYNSFYVYQYATGFTSAALIAEKIIHGENLSEYIRFLSAGGSNYPINVLGYAGVDLRTPAPICEALSVFKAYTKELGEALRK